MSGVKVNNGVVNYLGIPSQGAGLLANRPAAGVLGRLFIGTDTNAWYRDTGTAWVLISAGITGSAAAGQVAFWGTATTISGDNGLFWDNTNKRLGINTITPGVRLDIHGTSVIAQFNGTGTNNSYLDFQNAGVQQWRIGNTYNAGAQQFSFINNAISGNNTILTLTQVGTVAIGTTTPVRTLTVSGAAATYANIQGGAASDVGLLLGPIGNDAVGRFIYSNANNNLQFWTNSTQQATLLSTGFFGIGYTAPATMLAVSGSIYQGSNTANSNFQMLCNQNFYTVGFSPNFSTYTSGPVNISISANLGTGYVFKTAATITVNLPSASGLNNQLYFVVLTGTTVTVNRAGSDVIINTVGTSVTSLTLVGYTKVLLYCDGGTTWYQLF